MHQFIQWQVLRLEVLGIGPDPHRRALLAVTFGGAAHHQRLDHVAAREHQARDLGFAVGRDLQARRQRIRHADAHAMQTARKAVRPALALVELSPGVQTGVDQFDDRRVFLRVHAERDATAVVVDGHRSVGMQRDLDLFSMAGQGFVGRVVQHFLDHVQGIVRSRVHAGPLLHRLQAFENADRAFGIIVGELACHGGRL